MTRLTLALLCLALTACPIGRPTDEPTSDDGAGQPEPEPDTTETGASPEPEPS